MCQAVGSPRVGQAGVPEKALELAREEGQC